MVEDKRANSTELYDIVPEQHSLVVGLQKVQCYWNWDLVLKELQDSLTLTPSYVKKPKKLMGLLSRFVLVTCISFCVSFSLSTTLCNRKFKLFVWK